MLKGKKILLGVTGSIAAYKSAFLVRLLVKEGADVRVIMTNDACDFVAPLTFGTLSKSKVFTEFSEKSSGNWNNHVELGLWADIMLVAPATSNTIAKMANGICDNILLATYLSAKCPVYVAPAMDLDMYQHAATQKNLKSLKEFGNNIINVGKGELASGLEGEGRMAEPEEIVSILQKNTKKKTKLPKLAGKTVLISAGPTREAIDPVRYISNHSSGKMGFSLANVFAEYGAAVTLVSGPVGNLELDNSINRINVDSANEMYQSCMEHYKKCDIAIMSAAVADYTIEDPSKQKIKKQSDKLSLKLKKTKDILAEMGKKKKKQLLVGFALETNNELNNAKEKLKKKNADLIILNSLQNPESGFQYDTNQVTIVSNNNIKKYQLKHKEAVALDIASYINGIL